MIESNSTVALPSLSEAAARVKARVAEARAAQPAWAAQPVAERLAAIRRLRHEIANAAHDLAATVAHRPPAETLIAEVLPLADGCRFLEREAARLLAPRRLGRRGRPVWLAGTAAEIRREPHGVVLIVAPSNYPLLLPGAQLAQALAAGNAAPVKPGAGGAAAMRMLVRLAAAAGIDPRLCPVFDEDVASGEAAIGAGIDKLVLTGSAATGRKVLASLAPSLVPAVMELSGNDAVFVLDGADLDLVAAALAFGLRLNGSATCIAPRRVFVARTLAEPLVERLRAALPAIPPAPIPLPVARQVGRLLDEARAPSSGVAELIGGGVATDGSGCAATAAILAPSGGAAAGRTLGLLREDIFAPVMSVVPVTDEEEALDIAACCPYALGAAIFGPVERARALVPRIRAGSVTVNDVIAPTADPRLPFGGRGESGFGTTRGAEGLLEMTVLKSVTYRGGRFRPHYQPLRPTDETRFLAYVQATHAPAWRTRTRALRDLILHFARHGV